MEPNNFEKDFREKLNQREIDPSNNAWDRLDAMLSVAEEKKPKKSKKWLYIAASVVGFLLVGTVFFNQKENASDVLNTIQIQEHVVTKESTTQDAVTKPDVIEMDSNKTSVVITEKITAEQGIKEENRKNQKSNQVAQKASGQTTESSIIIKSNQETQSIHNQIAVAETAAKENTDPLLVNAEKSLVADNSVKSKSKIKVNAGNLLNQVDGELELSFREKIIAKVNKNYQTVKVALENRNQQD